ncbi:MAG TPA: tetratricopeptide repeat protein [Flavobacterium sp.]
MKNRLHLPALLLLAFVSSVSHGQKKELDSLKRMLPLVKIDSAKVNLYNRISNIYKESRPDSTFFYADKAAALAVEIDYDFGLANAFLNMGNFNIITGKYDKAKADFIKARTLFLELNKDSEGNEIKNGLAKAYASLGVVYSEGNDYVPALENYHHALKLYLETGQKNNLSKVCNNLGNIYKAQGNLQKALDSYKKALKIQQEIAEPAAAMSLTNIGAIYLEQNKLQEAYRSFKNAENLFADWDNKRGLALLKNYLGDYYVRKSDFGQAQQFYSISLGMYEEMQNQHGASLVLFNLGKLYSRQKMFPQALECANRSLRYATETGLRDQAFHSEKLLSEIHEATGNDKEALAYYKRSVALKDSIYTAENNKKFVRAEMEFDYKMKESLLLEKNKRQQLIASFSIIGGLLLIGLIFMIFNRRQVKRRLTLQKEVSEYEQKALHLQMNPHFVFNCLGAISSFIVQNGTDSALRYLSKFSKLMRLTLEYSKDSLIPIDKEIEGLQNYLELEQLRFHNSFEFEIHSSDKVEFNMGLPPLLIQPFVENAILHGLVPKEGPGKINVSFDVANNQLVCTITDNGIGIAKSMELKEHSVQAHQSMALAITKKRLEIMEATISKSAQIEIVENKNNDGAAGTRVTLRLPIQYIQ